MDNFDAEELRTILYCLRNCDNVSVPTALISHFETEVEKAELYGFDFEEDDCVGCKL